MHNRLREILLAAVLMAALSLPAMGQGYIIKSSLYMGTLDTGIRGPSIIISSENRVQDPRQPETNNLRLEEIAYYQSQLQSIYQLNRVEYLASSNLYWDGKQKKLRSTVLLDKDLCPIEITPKKAGAGRISLRVAIFKQAVRSGDKPESRSQEKNRTVKEGGLEDRKDLAALLDTEIVVGLDDSVVLGFPSEGKKYFLTLRISRHTLSSPYGMRPLPKIKEFNVLQSPKPVRQVTPQYPEPCKEQGIEGVVVLQVTIDKSGGVTNLKVLKDVHPLLDKAAVEALQQWIFEPVLLNKKPVSVFFNVTVNFRLPIR